MNHGHLHKDGDRYVVDFRKRVDLGVVTEAEARATQAAMAPPPHLDADGRLAYYEAEIARLRAQQGEAAPLAGVWDTYASSGKGNGTTGSTTGAYCQRWKSVLQWADEHGIVTLGQFNERTVQAMARDLGQKYAGTTLNSTMRAAKKVAEATVGRNGRNPFALYEPVKAASKDHRPFTTAELEMILSRAHREMLTACYLLTYTGQRSSDVGMWEWARVDFGAGVLWCRQRKTGARILLPMHPALATHLWNVKADQHPPRAHILPQLAAKQGVRANATAHAVNVFLKRLGLKTTAEGIVGSHSFRYSCVSIMRAAGVPDGAIAEITGHSTKAMMDRYSRVGLEARAAAIAQLPAFTGASEC